MEKILGYVESGKAEGARLLTGGARHGDKGFFVQVAHLHISCTPALQLHTCTCMLQPTVFSDVEDDMKICREEIFGPVQAIQKVPCNALQLPAPGQLHGAPWHLAHLVHLVQVANMEEAIERANTNSYGLAAAVFTQDVGKVTLDT